jgi:hypothetical protein
LLNSLAFLGFSRIEDIEKMGLREYYLRLEAYNLRRVQEQEDIAVQAWWNHLVTQQKGSAKHPKPRFREITELYDEQKMIDKVRSSFESDYQPQSFSHKSVNRAEIFAKRVEEFRKLKQAGKIIPLKERGISHG